MTNFDDQPYDPLNTQTGNNRSVASRPGLIRLSQERLQRMHPEIYEVQRPEDETFKIHVAEHLRYGLAEPAIVINLQPLVIAAYTNEIDAVAHLSFFSRSQAQVSQANRYPIRLSDELIQRHVLQPGSRLLTVNTFQRLAEAPYAPDLIPGPKARGVYGNFSPYIAEFLTSDLRQAEERKKEISESEWQRCQHLADEFSKHMIDRLVKPRDGRPMTGLHGIAQAWLPGHRPPHLRK